LTGFRRDQRLSRPGRLPSRVNFALAALAVGVFLAHLAGLGGSLAGQYFPGEHSTAHAAQAGPAIARQAKAFNGIPAVGALFTTSGMNDLLGTHFCTASVVDSPNRDLVLTAAHCVSGTSANKMAFVPGYHDGHHPYGVWAVTRVIIDRNWMSSANPDDDFAFLVVARPGRAAVQDITGGEYIDTSQPPGQFVRVIGYPDNAVLPISCQDRALRFSASQLEFDCGGYSDGTSGSPLITGMNAITGLGRVIGVIGGYEQGGYTPDVSYAAKFGPNVAALFKTAISES
jgi:V8-like Glu-specific endopeptidase